MAVLGMGFGKGTERRTQRQIANRYLACLRKMAIIEQEPTAPGVEYHLQRLNVARKDLESQLTDRQKVRVNAAYSRWYYRYLA